MERGVIVFENANRLLGEFVLQQYGTGLLGPGQRLLDSSLHAGTVLSWRFAGTSRGAIILQTPIVALVVPHDGRQVENLFGDGTNAVVDITLRRTPVLWHTAREVVDDLHGPAQFAKDRVVVFAGLDRV